MNIEVVRVWVVIWVQICQCCVTEVDICALLVALYNLLFGKWGQIYELTQYKWSTLLITKLTWKLNGRMMQMQSRVTMLTKTSKYFWNLEQLDF